MRSMDRVLEILVPSIYVVGIPIFVGAAAAFGAGPEAVFIAPFWPIFVLGAVGFWVAS